MSDRPGTRISAVEITNVSSHGFWLMIGERERFVPFKEFPWFKDARISELLHVELPSTNHLYWPDLDVDLAVESIDHPERFPLMSRVRSNKATSTRARPRHAPSARKKRSPQRG